MDRLQQLKSSLTELRSERLQIETDLQRRTRLEETKDELTDLNETLDREIVVSLVLSEVLGFRPWLGFMCVFLPICQVVCLKGNVVYFLLLLRG